MTEISEEKMAEIRDEVDKLVLELAEVLEGYSHGVALSAFGHIVGVTATHWVDLMQRCNAMSEMAAITYHESHAPTEH